MTAASVGNRARCAEEDGAEAFSSASDDEVGGPQARDARAAQNRRVTRLSRQCQHGSRAAVLRRSEQTRSSSTSDDEVGGE